MFKRKAAKTLARIPRSTRERIRTALTVLSADPDTQSLDVKPLYGRNGFRLRVGGWRVIYEVIRGRLIILVLEIGPRGDIYK